jgi:zinc/manganese transport system permease protein
LLALVSGLLCPLTGTLLLVQRRLFQANLISHAVLPGLALALALRLDPALGGVLSGVGGALVADRLSRHAPAAEGSHEAVLNTVLAGFLGLGVLLIPLLHLVALGAVLALLVGRYDQLVFLGVDPAGAASMGVPVARLQALMTLVTAFTVVSAMAAVGVVLVMALMGAPAVVALVGALSLRAALVRAAAVGLAVTALGFGLALVPAINLPPGPLIGVLCLGLLPLANLVGRGR